ncbi:hypothetical protein K1719_040414 [Acacia pycnantha]|nr:hypothetical protein K1719_040414 [Acacia pycnantha]
MGGIGKTTIAKAIYNEVGQSFEGKCFLRNVREVWKQDNEQVHLQEQLLSDILNSRKMAIPNIEMGKTLLKQKLSKKRVFVVLDDVSNENQLNALCGSGWFDHGSIIIITTRDERLLKFFGVIHVYTMKELDDKESLELFNIGIKRLIELSLVRVGNQNKLEIHNLLRDMGREIIREQSPKKQEKRTRLWSYDDVLEVLINETGTRSIEGLALDMSTKNSSSLSVDMFKKMKRLQNMPTNFNLEKIVAIELKQSNLMKVWKKSQLLRELKFVNLSHSHYLTETPNFSNIPHLEKLILKDCPRLCIIHPSIGDLKCILLLNLKDCKSLKHLPSSVYKLKSLKTLIICGCSKIDKLEEDIGQMESLTTLDGTQTAIAQVPFSLVGLKSIKHLSICGYEGSPRDVFPSLALSWMSPTHRSKSLSRAFQILPSLIRGISHPLFSRRYEIANDRPSTSQSSCQNTPALLGFHEQVHMERLETLMTLTIQVGWFDKTMDTLLKSISKGWNTIGLEFSLPVDNYPDWLVFANEGSSVSFKVPQVVNRYLKGIVLYIIYSSLQDSMASVHSIGIMINNFTKGTMDFYKREVATTFVNEGWQNMVSNLAPGNEVEVEIKLVHKYIVVKKTITYLLYAEEADNLITFE